MVSQKTTKKITLKRVLVFLACGSLLAVALMVATILYLVSPHRDAEVALGVDRLPWSAKNLSVSVDAWTDYVARGYVELSPKDCEKVLRARVYERDDHPTWELSGDYLPRNRVIRANTTFRWGNDETSCRLQMDDTRTWIVFEYSTD